MVCSVQVYLLRPQQYYTDFIQVCKKQKYLPFIVCPFSIFFLFFFIHNLRTISMFKNDFDLLTNIVLDVNTEWDRP